MRRPITFDEIRGHDWLVSYFKEHLKAGTLPHFLIIEGAEALCLSASLPLPLRVLGQ